MTKNNRMRLGHEALIMFVRRERALQHEHARAMQFPTPRPIGGESSGSRSRLSHGSSSLSHIHQDEASAASDDLPPLTNSYPGWFIDTLLLIHYEDHVAPYVWDGVVYLPIVVIFCFKQIRFE